MSHLTDFEYARYRALHPLDRELEALNFEGVAFFRPCKIFLAEAMRSQLKKMSVALSKPFGREIVESQRKQ